VPWNEWLTGRREKRDDFDFVVCWECDDCVKRASNVEDVKIVDDVLVLESERECPSECHKKKEILIECFCEGRLIRKEKAIIVIVPLQKICDVAVVSEECRRFLESFD